MEENQNLLLLQGELNDLLTKYANSVGAQQAITLGLHYFLSGFFFSITPGKEAEGEFALQELIESSKELSKHRQKILGDMLKGLFKPGGVDEKK